MQRGYHKLVKQHKFVKKSWGAEEWIENNELYCLKKIFIFKNNWSSEGKFHWHKIKDETFYVTDGQLLLEIKDKDNNVVSMLLEEGETYRIKPGTLHRFTTDSYYNCMFIEMSTQHKDSDSYYEKDN